VKRILILEDDPRVAKALRIRLSHAGYEVLTAPDPAFAALLAATHPPDLIISDLWMPVMQGFTFIRRRKSLGVAEVPFIFITASHKDGQWESAMELGAAGFFEKPYDPARLLAAIAEALQKQEAPPNPAPMRL
jgi:two-component system KDP operon response regulator KdpE